MLAVTRAVSTQIFGEHELAPSYYELIRASGFSTVELFAAPGHFAWDDERVVAQTARTLRSLDLSVCSLHAPWAPGQDVAAIDDDQRRRSLRAVEQAADALLAVGGKNLIMHPGANPAAPDMKEKQLRLAEESIARVALYCAARGLTVALENPPPYELAGSNADMLRLYEYFAGNPTVQACFDTGHAHVSQEGVAAVQHVPKDIPVVHLSDNTGQADDHWLPPSGTIAWRPFFQLLSLRQWQGYLVLELTDRPDAAEALASGWRWLNEMLVGMA